MTEQELKNELVKMRWHANTLEIAIRAKFRCEYCGCDLMSSVDLCYSIQIDHIVPGYHGGTDEFDNQAFSCRTCNFIKRTWNPAEHSKPGADRDELIDASRNYINEKRTEKQKEIDLEVELIQKLLKF